MHRATGHVCFGDHGRAAVRSLAITTNLFNSYKHRQVVDLMAAAKLTHTKFDKCLSKRNIYRWLEMRATQFLTLRLEINLYNCTHTRTNKPHVPHNK